MNVGSESVDPGLRGDGAGGNRGWGRCKRYLHRKSLEQTDGGEMSQTLKVLMKSHGDRIALDKLSTLLGTSSSSQVKYKMIIVLARSHRFLALPGKFMWNTSR